MKFLIAVLVFFVSGCNKIQQEKLQATCIDNQVYYLRDKIWIHLDGDGMCFSYPEVKK